MRVGLDRGAQERGLFALRASPGHAAVGQGFVGAPAAAKKLGGPVYHFSIGYAMVLG